MGGEWFLPLRPRGLDCLQSMGVDALQREMPAREPYLARMAGNELLEWRRDLLAVRTIEVAEIDDDNRRICRPDQVMRLTVADNSLLRSGLRNRYPSVDHLRIRHVYNFKCPSTYTIDWFGTARRVVELECFFAGFSFSVFAKRKME